MKVLVAIFALVALTNGLKVKLNDRQCGPDETSCPAGCCPEANWFCCPDNMYCAATAADCPFVAKKAQLMKMAKNKQEWCWAPPVRKMSIAFWLFHTNGFPECTSCLLGVSSVFWLLLGLWGPLLAEPSIVVLPPLSREPTTIHKGNRRV